MIKKRSLLDKLGGKTTTQLPAASVNSALGRSVGSYQPSIQPIQQPIIPKPILPSVNLSRPVTRDLGTPTLRESTQRANAKQSEIDREIEKKTKQQASDRAKMLERQLEDKYGINIRKTFSPMDYGLMKGNLKLDEKGKKQFDTEYAEYLAAKERSNPFNAGADAGFNILPTMSESLARSNESFQDVQTAKGYGAGRLVGGIGQQFAFNSVLGPGIESLTSKLLPKATPFVAETIKDVAIGTGTQLAEAPFDKPTAGQFAGNVALDIALNALFGVVGKGLSKVDLSNLKTAKPSQVVGDVAQKLNVSIVEADKLVDDAIDFYVNQSGVADTKQFDQLQLEAPKTKDLSDVSNTLSSKLRAKQSDMYVNQFGVADTKQFEQLQLEAPVRTNSDASGMRLSEKVKVAQEEMPTLKTEQELTTVLKTKNLSEEKTFQALDNFDELVRKNVPVNQDGTVTLYHHTNSENAGKIISSKKIKGLEDGVFFTTKPNGQASGFGDTVIKANIPLEKLQIDDIFSDEIHLRIPTSRIGQSVSIEASLHNANEVTQPKINQPQLDRPSEFSIGAKYPLLAEDFVREVPKPARPRIEPTLKPIDRPSDFSVKKPIYPTLDPKFAKERPSVITASDVKRIEPTLKPTKNIASKVESPTMTKVDNVASKFESENLTTGDNILNSGEIKERGFSENIRTDKNRVDELRKEFDENPEFYETLSNKSTLESAQARFDRGYDEAVKDFRATSDTIRADNVPLAKLIADEAVKRGDMETAREIVVKAAESLTKAGQFSQAAKILRETNDPITVMRFVNNEIKKLNTQGSKRYGKGWENIKLDENELDLIAKITKDTSDEQKEEVFQQIFDSMVKRIPTTKREKFDAWRRIAMLFNPKTHVRNTLGNGLMRGLKTIADKQAQVMELSIPKELRTKGFATKELKEVSKNYFDANKKTLLEGSRWEIFGVASPFSEKRIFKNQFLESLNDISKKTLEGEDIFFFKSNFISDLAGFMNARGLKEPTEEAVAYALRRSQEATFRQANAVANAINTMKGSRIGLLVDAAIPFTKTPANILQTGIDYSPIGAMKSVVQILNKAEPQVAIENLSKGLTGTGLALIGAWASYNGLARGAYEKSNKVEGLYQATGMLPNSIKTPGGSYTIDWAQPIAMPFFMGVAFMDELKKGGQTKADAAFNALLQSGETLVQQSMLSGVKDLFGGYGTMTEKIIQLPINYMTQGFPTVGGQIARVIDPLKRQIDYSNIIDSTTTSLQARTPGLSIDLPVKRDILGKPQEYGKGLLNVFQQFLSPGFIGKESKDPVVNEISRLYESEGADFLPKARVTNFTDEKIKYNLTTKEISEVQKIMGEYTNKQLSSMINSYEYRNATDAERAKMIKKANETGYDLAKKTIVEARKK